MLPADEKPQVGYVVSNLFQRFVLTEILALERQGISLRIFSANDPGQQALPQQPGSEVICISLKNGFTTLLISNLWLTCTSPGRYFRTFIRALGYGPSKIIRPFLQAGFLTDTLRKLPISHLHAHGAAAALIAMFVHQLTGISYTLTAHDQDFHSPTNIKLLRAELQSARALVTTSESERRHLLDRLGHTPNGRIRRINKGVNLVEFKLQRSEVETPVIISVGRLIEKNGFSSLISTAHVLRQRGYRFRLEIIGTGPLATTLQEKVKRLELEHHVRFLGVLQTEVVRSLLQRATVFVLPRCIASNFEPQSVPTIMLEAMATAVPIVSTTAPGIADVIRSGRNGLLVNSSNPLQFADAIAALLTDPRLRDRLGRSARQTVEARFSIERNCLDLLALFGNREFINERLIAVDVPRNRITNERRTGTAASLVS